MNGGFMETALWVLIHIAQGLEFIVDTLLHNIVDYSLITFSIVIMLDDVDTLKAMENVKKKNIRNKVEERNETFEAITTTKGHTDSKIQKRYNLVMLIGFLILLIEEHFIPGNIISKILSACALGVTIAVKRKSNQNYDRLKRTKTQ